MDGEVGIILPPAATFFMSLNQVSSGTTREMAVSEQSLTVRRLPSRCGLFSAADTDDTSRESAQCFVLHTTKAPWLLVFPVREWSCWVGNSLKADGGQCERDPPGCHVALSLDMLPDSLPPHSFLACCCCMWLYLSLLEK